MTIPFIIWTTPRTGGTTLYEALWRGSLDLLYVDDEPFSSVWHPVFDGWRRMGVTSELRFLFQSVPHYAVKHILDPWPDSFNALLADESSEAGYAHVHLTRRDEFAWLASRGVALQLDAWNPVHSRPLIDDVLAGRRVLEPLDVPALVAYSREVRRQWEAVVPHLGPTIEVAYEDLYGSSGPIARDALSAFLSVRGDLSGRLAIGSQDTSRVWHLIPNIDELRAVAQSTS